MEFRTANRQLVRALPLEHGNSDICTVSVTEKVEKTVRLTRFGVTVLPI